MAEKMTPKGLVVGLIIEPTPVPEAAGNVDTPEPVADTETFEVEVAQTSKRVGRPRKA